MCKAGFSQTQETKDKIRAKKLERDKDSIPMWEGYK